MTLGDDRSEQDAAGLGTFRPERFGWDAPDRLIVVGTFSGLTAPIGAAPVLVLQGTRTHRLPALADLGSGAPEEGRPWHAMFGWQQAPADFVDAELELGDGVLVELPRIDGGDDAHAPVPLRRVWTPDLAQSRTDAVARTERSGREAVVAPTPPDPELDAAIAGQAADAEQLLDALTRIRDAASTTFARHDEALRLLVTEILRSRDDIAARDRLEAQLRAQLEEARATGDAARADAERRLAEAEAARAEADAAIAEAKAARAEAERLTAALARVRDVIGGGR